MITSMEILIYSNLYSVELHIDEPGAALCGLSVRLYVRMCIPQWLAIDFCRVPTPPGKPWI